MFVVCPAYFDGPGCQMISFTDYQQRLADLIYSYIVSENVHSNQRIKKMLRL